MTINFSEILKMLRLKNNLSQNELAKKLKVSVNTISSWENSKSIPKASMLVVLHQFLTCGVIIF